MKRALRIAGVVVGALVVLALVGLGAFYHHVSNPSADPRALPSGLIAATSPEGAALLSASGARADHPRLTAVFGAQKKLSWCGVASSVIALRALDIAPDLTQESFFDAPTSEVRSELAVTFAGMSLPELGALLEARGAQATVVHASAVDLDGFRAAAKKNLETAGDVIVVNYHRAVLDQGDPGHISPLAAFDAASDRVLVLDTAAYRWPATWIPVAKLYEAMNTVDPSSGKTRGYVEITRR